jgi:uncharacterized protein
MPEPLIHFPAEFPIKVMGKNNENLCAIIQTLLEPICGPISNDAMKKNESKKGNFQSITVTITATSKTQLDSIYQTLSDHPSIMMCL